MAGVEQEDDGRHEFVLAEPAFLALGREKPADEVVARLCAARLAHSADEAGEVARRVGRAVLDRARHAELVHRDHPVRPVEKLRRNGARDADEVGDDGDRNGRREGLDEVGRAVADECVDPLVRQRGDGGLKLLDLARDEGAVDEASEARVLGRLHFEDRMALERVEGGEMRPSAAASRAPRGS